MTTPQLGPALEKSDLRASLSWWARPPRHSGAVDQATFDKITEDVVRAIGPHVAAGTMAELRAVLLKALAATASASVHHDTDNDVFKLSLDVREDVYSEVMSFRRAINRDAGRGALDA